MATPWRRERGAGFGSARSLNSSTPRPSNTMQCLGVMVTGLPARAGELRVRVDIGQRQMAKDVAQVAAEVLQELAHDRLGPAAVRALEVAVLDEGDGRVVGAADVVTLGIDRRGEVDDRLGGPRELA